MEQNLLFLNVIIMDLATVIVVTMIMQVSCVKVTLLCTFYYLFSIPSLQYIKLLFGPFSVCKWEVGFEDY